MGTLLKLMALLLITSPLLGKTVVPVDRMLPRIDVGDKFFFLIDEERRLSLKQVAEDRGLEWKAALPGPWTSEDAFSQSVYIHFTLESAYPQDVVFRNEYSLPFGFTFSCAIRPPQGDLRPLQKLDFIKPSFVISLEAGHTAVFCNTPRLMAPALPMTIYPLESFLPDNASSNTFYGIVYGIAVAMLLYNLSMFIYFRRFYFLAYILYVLAFTTVLMFASGHLPGHAFLVWNLPLILSGVFLYLFKSSALDLKKHIPRLHKFFLVCLIVHIINGFSSLVLSGMNVMATTPLVLFAGLLCATFRTAQGYKPAIFFVLGWCMFFVGYILASVNLKYFNNSTLYYSSYVGFALEILFFSFATGYKARLQEREFSQQNEHAFKQLQKVFYRHQIIQIKKSAELESTMPTSDGEACVISFDIIASSQIQHIMARDLFRKVFSRCNEVMMEGYDGIHLRARSYRIKEMGDGFLCSIGYPFQALSANVAMEAVDISRRFHQILKEEAAQLHMTTPICCGIGIAIGHLSGFYPDSGAKEYDLYGRAIVLAKRYEAMRKALPKDTRTRSVLILQEKVHVSLSQSAAKDFVEYDLDQNGATVRDDPKATRLYYQYLD